MIARHEKPVGRPCGHRIYGLSCDEFEALRERAGDQCELCGITAKESPYRVLHIDHDGAWGAKAEVRGLLCGRCNTGLELDTVVSPEKRRAYKANAFHLSLPDKQQKQVVDEATHQWHVDNLTTRSREYRQAKEELDAVRAQLKRAVIAEYLAGSGTKEIAARAGQSAEQIRRIRVAAEKAGQLSVGKDDK